jgi:hypothetical protein
MLNSHNHELTLNSIVQFRGGTLEESEEHEPGPKKRTIAVLK